MLQPGDAIPHVTLRTRRGSVVSYCDLWQRRNLVLVLAPDNAAMEPALDAYVNSLKRTLPADTALVVSVDPVEGLPPLTLVIADRWGEIHHVATAPAIGGLPGPDAVMEWLEFVRVQCPECQGETR